MKPIRACKCRFPTVQEALLAIMDAHDTVAASCLPLDDPRRRELVSLGNYDFLVKALGEIRSSIAARAVPDEDVAA